MSASSARFASPLKATRAKRWTTRTIPPIPRANNVSDRLKKQASHVRLSGSASLAVSWQAQRGEGNGTLGEVASSDCRFESADSGTADSGPIEGDLQNHDHERHAGCTPRRGSR